MFRNGQTHFKQKPYSIHSKIFNVCLTILLHALKD